MPTGGCRCGAVRYDIAAQAPPPVYCCHCLTCQRWSGSAFAEQAIVPETTLSVTGPVIDYHVVNANGSQSHHRLCGVCHARIYNTNSARAGLAVMRAGTLGISATLVPRVHIWTSRKQPWIVIGDDVPSFAENADPDDFIAIMIRP